MKYAEWKGNTVGDDDWFPRSYWRRELSLLLQELGCDGGRMSASIYETAQVLRLYPGLFDPAPVVDWLLAQQQEDGGWGGGADALYRTAPTLAAVLALHAYPSAPGAAAVRAGVRYVHQCADSWGPPVPDRIPVAAELIVPDLLAAGIAAGLPVESEPFAAVMALGRRRRALIDRLKPGPGSSAVFSWEAWGTTPKADLVDAYGSVGSSPAATAAWLRLAAQQPYLAQERRRAEDYLRAATSMLAGVPAGVMPSAWPMHRFEQSFALHALLMGDLLSEPELQPALNRQLSELQMALRPEGLGFTDHFAPDGDDTAAAVAVLAAAGRLSDAGSLASFAGEAYCSSYPCEMHASTTVTARASHALTLLGLNSDRWRGTVATLQLPDGRWESDKWNVSWLYSTAVALLPFRKVHAPRVKASALEVLLRHQRRCGGWGAGTTPTAQETAYAVLALHTLAADENLPCAALEAMQRGKRFLARHFEDDQWPRGRLWIIKELYGPERIDRAFILAALLAPAKYTGQPVNREAVAVRSL